MSLKTTFDGKFDTKRNLIKVYKSQNISTVHTKATNNEYPKTETNGNRILLTIEMRFHFRPPINFMLTRISTTNTPISLIVLNLDRVKQV